MERSSILPTGQKYKPIKIKNNMKSVATKEVYLTKEEFDNKKIKIITFKQVELPDNSTIYFIDNKRTTEQNFEYQTVLCNVQNKKTCNSFSGFTKSGNRFYQCEKY